MIKHLLFEQYLYNMQHNFVQTPSFKQILLSSFLLFNAENRINTFNILRKILSKFLEYNVNHNLDLLKQVIQVSIIICQLFISTTLFSFSKYSFIYNIHQYFEVFEILSTLNILQKMCQHFPRFVN